MPINVSPNKGEKQSDFVSRCMGNTQMNKEFTDQKQRAAVCYNLWKKKRAKAAMVVKLKGDERLYGDIELSDAEVADVEDHTLGFVIVAEDDKPYGNVSYADPGYQKDGKKRYPIDTEEHIRAAWSYFSKPANSQLYTPGQRAKIKARIIAAWRKVIDPKGPPSDQGK